MQNQSCLFEAIPVKSLVVAKSPNGNAGSLRNTAAYWLGISSGQPMRVIRTGRGALDKRRYVEVEAFCESGPLSVILFRRDGRYWSPVPEKLSK